MLPTDHAQISINGTEINWAIPSTKLLNALVIENNLVVTPTIPAPIAPPTKPMLIARVIFPFRNASFKPFSEILPVQKIVENNDTNKQIIGIAKFKIEGSYPSGSSALVSGTRGCTPSPRSFPSFLALNSSLYMGPILRLNIATNITVNIANNPYMLNGSI
ncbi:hypothetical protein SDC9_124218 [bioreactor metagenome]|uniref:Uncharacterized protein n=1 Tax=bioreactor metagenome TaxID=1076179 RepID=A0A645CJY7_9ZZZZ